MILLLCRWTDLVARTLLNPIKNIRAKASLYVLLLLIATASISYFIAIQIVNEQITSEIIKRAESLARGVASTAGYNFLSQDLLGLDNMIFKIKSSNPDIEYITIVSPRNEIVVHSDLKRSGEKFAPAQGTIFRAGPDGTIVKDVASPGGDFFEISSPVVFADKPLGSIVLGINKSVLSAAQRNAQRRIIMVFAAILALGMISSLLLSSFLTRPIKELSSGVEELKDGKRSRPLRIYSEDELGRLTKSFNEMTGLITSQRDRLSKYSGDLEEAYVATVRVLAAAIDARDHYTLGHSTRVSQLSVQLAREIGLGEKEAEEIEIACLFHDVGKIKIPDAILHKKGVLTPAEKREMMRHTEYGTEILSKAPSLYKFIPAVRHHHEWYDGTGYPDGLSRDKIPLHAAIVSLADALDAMTSDRPYRDALTTEEALAKIVEFSGRQFDPELVKSFLKITKKKNSAEPMAAVGG